MSFSTRSRYPDRSGQVGSRFSQVQQTRDGYAVGQVVDEGHIVDQVVCLSDTQDDYCGETLKTNRGLQRSPAVFW